ncbi:MAG: DUF885 domain-containing protein [Brevundimonas sp.]|uniref:DUF885 domain-containing protein n=1 Tax=Brevundimonas sp. TaxID=1871086 RepID=UPI00391BE5BD
MSHARKLASVAVAGLILGAGLAGCAATGLADQPREQSARSMASIQLDAIIADYERFARGLDPISEGREGNAEARARMPDWSREAELARVPHLEGFQRRLARIDTARLSDDERLNHAFLSAIIDEALEEIALDLGRLAFRNEGGVGQSLAYIARTTRLSNRADADAWLSRLRQMGKPFDDSLANARRGLETGMVQPRPTVEAALIGLRNEAAFTPETDPLLVPFDTLPASFPAPERERLRAEAIDIINAEIAPRRREWVRFLEQDYLPRAPEQLGIGNRPGGREAYAWLARSFTTTDLTPDQIHAIGLSEVARIRARMEVEMRASGWTGDFASFLQFLRTDPRFYARTREELLEKASEMSKRADDAMPSLFATLPRLPYGVRPVPLEIEETYTTGRYFPGSLENGVAGGYIVNTGRLDQRPLYELPALTLHEAVPGHHHQIALQQEAGEQPWFRRNAGITAFVEGWGLYAEFLGEEMGFYRDPYERFGRLSYEMWRACRLVADTGIHWMGWDIEQARACFAENSALAPHNIETELQRYISWPGQALAYKIGEIRLREIRVRAETALGEAFNVRTFHDALLVNGPLPLSLLDQHMDRWIAAQASPVSTD